MSTKLYIGGLSYDTSDEGLRDAFAQAGTVTSASVIRDRMTGRSRGFGFVEMSSDEEAQKAIAAERHHADGRTLTVNRPVAGPEANARRRWRAHAVAVVAAVAVRYQRYYNTLSISTGEWAAIAAHSPVGPHWFRRLRGPGARITPSRAAEAK
jgi:RNA recognition motif-containing protein